MLGAVVVKVAVAVPVVLPAAIFTAATEQPGL